MDRRRHILVNINHHSFKTVWIYNYMLEATFLENVCFPEEKR